MIRIKNVFVYINGKGAETALYDNEFDRYVIQKERKIIKIAFDNEIVKIHAENHKNSPYGYQYFFSENKGISIEIEVDAKNALGCEMYSPFWSRPAFAAQDLSKLPQNLRGVLVKKDIGYMFVLPICNDKLRCNIGGGNSENTLFLNIDRLCGGYSEICGVCAVCAESENPYDAVSKAYAKAVENRLIDTPLRDEKKYPKMFEYLGWCSWNACYHNVDENVIMQKAEELKNKNVPVKWFLIDDGWSKYDGFELTSLEADERKFKAGFSALTDRLRDEYEISYIGVWHSLTAYWFGIKKDSELYKKHEEWFFKTNLGVYMPKPQYAYEFFEKWYEYLKKEKIDFIKIDSQGNLTEFFKGLPDACKKVREYQKNADKAAYESFCENVLGCMGLDSINCQARPYTPIIRNGDDYFPDIKGSFKSHAIKNAYNAVFNRDLYYCDFDMWWTNHESVIESAMLRAISGGPVYISDKVGETEREALLPLADSKGKIYRCDDCARATEDCLFTDTVKEKKALKLFNKKGNNGAVALFNLTDDEVTAYTGAKDFYGKGKYLAYVYTTKKFYDCENIEIKLRAGKSEIVNFYKINNGFVEIGDLSKYVSIADESKKRVEVRKIKIESNL